MNVCVLCAHVVPSDLARRMNASRIGIVCEGDGLRYGLTASSEREHEILVDILPKGATQNKKEKMHRFDRLGAGIAFSQSWGGARATAHTRWCCWTRSFECLGWDGSFDPGGTVKGAMIKHRLEQSQRRATRLNLRSVVGTLAAQARVRIRQEAPRVLLGLWRHLSSPLSNFALSDLGSLGSHHFYSVPTLSDGVPCDMLHVPFS